MSTVLYWLGIIALLFALIVVIGIPVWFWESRAKKKKLQQVFADREALDEFAFYERYFKERGIPLELVSKIRTILEEELEADLSRLSANDDFKKNLSFFWEYDSMADVEVVIRIEKEFDIKISDHEVWQTYTVEDLINLVWGKLQQRAA
jgi:acyl carrier protein